MVQDSGQVMIHEQMRKGLPGSAFALVARSVLNKERVFVTLVPRLESTFGLVMPSARGLCKHVSCSTYRRSPRTDWVHITLGFTSTSTVRMVR